MDNEDDAAIAADADSEPDTSEDLGGGTIGAPASSTEKRIRRLAGRTAAYRGEIVAITRGWVSRDGKLHLFAARYLDFAVLTPEHLVLCSTGFFTRQPRRRVFREPLSRLVAVPIGPEPVRSVRIVGDFDRPILLELRAKPDGIAFVEELLARTHSAEIPDATPAPPPDSAPDAPAPAP